MHCVNLNGDRYTQKEEVLTSMNPNCDGNRPSEGKDPIDGHEQTQNTVWSVQGYRYR